MLLTSVANRGFISFFLGFLLCYSIIAFYIRETCYRDPSSVFFRPEHARVLSYSSYRKTQAKKYAAQAALHEPVKWTNATAPEICVAIGSVSRHGFSYLKETIGSILEGLDDIERQQLYVVVFLAHSNQTVHEDYGQAWLGHMADSLPTYPKDDTEMLKLIVDLETRNDYAAHARKQKIDYSILLGECAKVNPVYTLTLEDDVIALDGWFHRTLSALRTVARKSREMGKDSFLYLRIFYDGRLLGWNSEEWPYYLGWSVMAVLAESAIIFFLRWRFSSIRKVLPPLLVLFICGVCTPMLIGLFFAAGRSCMLPKQPGVSLMPKYGCCGQGLVFPQQQVTENLLPMYRDTTDSHAAVDSFMEDWANSHDALRWAVTPVLIQHVGGKSTHGAGDQRSGRLTDDMPFDYPFETNDPIELAKEHQLLIDSLKGDI